jgi:hypothetical protein
MTMETIFILQNMELLKIVESGVIATKKGESPAKSDDKKLEEAKHRALMDKVYSFSEMVQQRIYDAGLGAVLL